jgi:hypothetical protein
MQQDLDRKRERERFGMRDAGCGMRMEVKKEEAVILTTNAKPSSTARPFNRNLSLQHVSKQ